MSHNLFCLLCLVVVTYGYRAQRASKSDLRTIEDILNAEARTKVAQDDASYAFEDVKWDPSSKLNKDELSFNNWDDYFQGDVDLTVQQIGLAPVYHLWNPTQPISFDFADTVPPPTRTLIKKALKLWQDNTCLLFEENGPYVDRLEFFDGGGCSSYVGKVGGTQGISISTPGCDTVGIISHEIGHALGSFHEQARPDQFRHVWINYNNIPLKRWNNFQPVHASIAGTYQMPYDTGSVMHYGPFGFAENSLVPTIRTLDRNQQSTIGQRQGPSFLDFAAINAAYGCSSRCPPLNCQQNGYVNPRNCSECLCPVGFSGKYCEETKQSNYHCGGTIYARKVPQYIQSPDYPEYPTENVECIWRIVASNGSVFFKFENVFDFRCDTTCDRSFVEVKYHSDKRLTGARFCCARLPQTVFSSTNNEMIILLRGYERNSGIFSAQFWSNGNDEVEQLTTTQSTTTTSERTTPFTPRPTVSSTLSTEFPINFRVSPSKGSRPHKITKEVLPFTVPFSFLTTTKQIYENFTSTTPIPKQNVTEPSGILKSEECECSEWSDWENTCNQECGGCGHRKRSRTCDGTNCRLMEKRPCNFKVCPSGTNFLINNGEFHILWRGCCVGLFRSGNECSAMETNSNSLITMLASLFDFKDEATKVSRS
ncbi:unnamed protein product [Auanema sp. JU1783]|nr:unnamed protein product [Auanema sp. JU1783]